MAHSASDTTQRDYRQAPPSQASARRWKLVEGKATVLVMATAFGAVFGFLLQKGGVAKFDILIGVLLLQNFVVIQVILSAIIVGMIGFHLLERLGLVERHIKPTRYGGNAIGGLVFGAGFALLAYCPGTAAAAVGQGNYDALVGVLGMVLGSYLFAIAHQHGFRKVTDLGERGKLTLPALVGLSPVKFVAMAVPALVAVLVLLEWLDAR